jgi:hypothetical protein
MCQPSREGQQKAQRSAGLSSSAVVGIVPSDEHVFRQRGGCERKGNEGKDAQPRPCPHIIAPPMPMHSTSLASGYCGRGVCGVSPAPGLCGVEGCDADGICIPPIPPDDPPPIIPRIPPPCIIAMLRQHGQPPAAR